MDRIAQPMDSGFPLLSFLALFFMLASVIMAEAFDNMAVSLVFSTIGAVLMCIGVYRDARPLIKKEGFLNLVKRKKSALLGMIAFSVFAFATGAVLA